MVQRKDEEHPPSPPQLLAQTGRKRSFPRSLPQLEEVNGSYVISQKCWEQLNRELRLARIPRPPLKAGNPPQQQQQHRHHHPQHPVPRPPEMTGLNYLFAGATRRHIENPPETELQEAEAWRGLIFLVTSARRTCSKINLSLPKQRKNAAESRTEEDRTRRAEEMKLRYERQWELLSGQSPEKTWHQEATEQLAASRDEARDSELKDTAALNLLERKLKKQKEQDLKKEKEEKKVEKRRMSQHEERVRARRDQLRKKEEAVAAQEKVIEAMFTETQKCREQWEREKEEQGHQATVTIDLSNVDPRTGGLL